MRFYLLIMMINTDHHYWHRFDDKNIQSDHKNLPSFVVTCCQPALLCHNWFNRSNASLLCSFILEKNVSLTLFDVFIALSFIIEVEASFWVDLKLPNAFIVLSLGTANLESIYMACCIEDIVRTYITIIARRKNDLFFIAETLTEFRWFQTRQNDKLWIQRCASSLLLVFEVWISHFCYFCCYFFTHHNNRWKSRIEYVFVIFSDRWGRR